MLYLATQHRTQVMQRRWPLDPSPSWWRPSRSPTCSPGWGLVCRYFQKQASPGAEHLWPATSWSRCSYPCLPLFNHQLNPTPALSPSLSLQARFLSPTPQIAPLNYYRNDIISLTLVLRVTLGRKVSSHLCLWRRNDSRTWNYRNNESVGEDGAETKLS